MFEKKPTPVTGAMSGTSLDGVDGATLVTDGERIFDFGETAYRPYSAQERDVLHGALGKWPEDAGLDEAAAVILESHAEIYSQLGSVGLCGFHGQTLAHDPKGQGTHQLGDGQALADRLETPVVWDFRSADVALGGQGAPLAPFFHFACAKWMGADAPFAILNLGGVGNLTWIDPRKSRPEEEGALLAFDTGPANAPINDFVQNRFGVAMDEGGAKAAKGRVADGALDLFLADPYFHKIPPKSLDRDAFQIMFELVSELSEHDAVATLSAMCAASVMIGVDFCPKPPERLLVTGGGRHNPVIMEMIAAGLKCPVSPIEDAGLNGDMLEAQAFAYLAMRVACGLPTSCASTTGVSVPIGGGVLSYPH